jgi:chemotaxis protein MotB
MSLAPNAAKLWKAPLSDAGARTWLITFVDLVMLLLTFFILLFAMSRPEAARYVPVAQSYVETFRPIAAGDEPLATPQSYVLEARPAEGLAYLESVLKTVLGRSPAARDIGFRLSEQSLILYLPSPMVTIPAGAASAATMTTALFDLGGVLANIDNRIAVRGFVAPEDASAGAWTLAIARAAMVTTALRETGYTRPVAATARLRPVDVAANVGAEVVIMAEDDAGSGDAHD